MVTIKRVPGGVPIDTPSGQRVIAKKKQNIDVVIGSNFPQFPTQPFNPNKNFFDRSRAGAAVVRPADFVVLRLEWQNLNVQAGSPPRLVKGNGPATLVVHFPPQSIVEQTFLETAATGVKPPTLPWPDRSASGNPGTDTDPLPPPPVRARIAGESRLAFSVPDGFDIDYTLEGVLDAMQTLPLAVGANARPPAPAAPKVNFSDLFNIPAGLIPVRQLAAMTSYALRTLRIAAMQDTTTLQLRQASGGFGLRAFPLLTLPKVRQVPALRIGKTPANPTPQQTAIELPWRLILSPYASERWRHAVAPGTSEQTRHTELWHSRLVAPVPGQDLIESPNPDPQRTVRAVWALTGEGSTQSMSASYPTPVSPENPPVLPLPNNMPFRMPLEDYDRFQIAHLSSNASMSNYSPEPIGTNLLMLSALGAWLDSRGAWDPVGMPLEEWTQRTTMGRDHYVRVVYRGILVPFGHRVALIKVSERKFHPSVAGNVAYLRQRLFIVVRQPERLFANTDLTNREKTIYLHRKMPFSSVRLITTVTPNLDDPSSTRSKISNYRQVMFWPCVNSLPFKFDYVATDLDGRKVSFSLPAIFMDDSKASPRKFSQTAKRLRPDFPAAEAAAQEACENWNADSRVDDTSANLNRQRVAMALSVKAGDTCSQIVTMRFDAFAQIGNLQLQAYSQDLSGPIFYPGVLQANVQIAALSQLLGSSKSNNVSWNAYYLKSGFDPGNKGEVYLDVLPEDGMATLDFSTQGDRGGGFVQPNMRPSAVSRLTGPVTGNVASFIAGKMSSDDAFPSTLSGFPLPLLFGCIPLGAVIEDVLDLTSAPDRIPKFASEAGTKVESLINDLIHLFELVSNLADQPARVASGAVLAQQATLDDLANQSAVYAAGLVADAKTSATQLKTALASASGVLASVLDKPIDTAPALNGLPSALAAITAAALNVQTSARARVAGVALPSGLSQNLLQAAQVAGSFAQDVALVPTLIAQGRLLFDALKDIVGHPDQIDTLFADPVLMKTRLLAVGAALTPVRDTLAAARLMEGAPRQTALTAIDAVAQVLQGAQAITDILEMLTGDELTLRFDWNPQVKNWPAGSPIFKANDPKGFLVAVQARVRKNGQSAPTMSVVCSLKNFDLVLIAPASFMELNFEKIEFRVDSGAKMVVDVLLTDIKFVGPLSFVETLRDLIPLDGFSDPPHLDITPQGIDAGFSVALPALAIGVFNLSNLSLGAGFTVPFIGQPLAVRFNFCSREQPFNLSVCMFGGGGFFSITIDPGGVQIMEAALEFGASISVNLGVASGGVHVMAGIYFRMENKNCTLAGYFRMGGCVSVLGIVSVSIELYLELRYESASGKCAGIAKLTIEIDVFMFSVGVTITCEKKFAGSNGDPAFRDLMGVQPALPLPQELALIDDSTEYAWREYAEAFA